jgi:hypothetical protein
MTTSYLIHHVGWVDEQLGVFSQEDKAPGTGWTAVYTLHDASALVAKLHDEPQLDFGDNPEPERVANCPIQRIIHLYHTHMPTCDRVMLDSEARNTFIRARWREVVRQGKFKTQAEGLAFFEQFFRSAGASKFLTGQTQANSKDRQDYHWKADLMWLMRPGNFVKVAEGKYQ